MFTKTERTAVCETLVTRGQEGRNDDGAMSMAWRQHLQSQMEEVLLYFVYKCNTLKRKKYATVD
ncbi:unnamed protein product [Cyprideis torosa]|uniref:Uncharacterized protein n=1 Tax=Cyprideis torosa TaxID=163714 RepID=A0A7R8ZQQ1_9CRUS|nr:unnamed protein product [Cyprideis torosa]CAG0901909.1 unnamed protein product [Cyprideis torosa]